MKKHLWIAALLPLIFVGCKDDKVSEAPTPEEASVQLNNLANQAETDVVTLIESEGVRGMQHLLELAESFDFSARKKDQREIKMFLNELTQSLIYGPNARVTEDDDLSFDQIKGLYEWNPTTETFDESESDFFIVRFPTEGSATNNAELKISELEFVTIKEDNGDFIDEYQLPSAIDAYLKVDDETVIELDASIDWSSDALPEKVDLVLFVDPFTFTLGFDESFPQMSSLVTSVKLEDEVILGVDVDVEFTSSDKEDPKKIEGFIQYYNLKIAGSVDAESLDNDPEADPNDHINLELLLDDAKVGDIMFEDDLAYVVYADGSKELLEELLQPVIDEIEDLLSDFE
ncbi:MAG: hypothetical protein Tsb0034_04790 [Ekhidna sp.]